MDFKQSLELAKGELKHLQQELGECMKKQAELEKKIAAVRQMIVGFSDALGEKFIEEDTLGLTDAIRQAFKTAGRRLAPTEVKDRLESIGYDTSKYGNMMASVHSVINRLVQQKQLQQINVGGKPGYEWIPQTLVEQVAEWAEATQKKK